MEGELLGMRALFEGKEAALKKELEAARDRSARGLDALRNDVSFQDC